MRDHDMKVMLILSLHIIICFWGSLGLTPTPIFLEEIAEGLVAMGAI